MFNKPETKMKKVMFALCFMFGGIVAVIAQDTQDTTSNQYRTETESQYPQDAQAQQQGLQYQQDLERIQSTELPDEVKRALEGQEYRGWLISGAFKAKSGDDQSSMESDTRISGQDDTDTQANRQENTNATDAEDEEVYIVELKNGAETKTLRFDKDGQKLGDLDETQSSQYNQGEFNRENPNNQYNQNEQPEQADPNMESGQTDPSSTDDPAEQSQYQQSTETRTDQESPQSSETDTEQPTETQSSQSTQTDQSKANEPE